MNGKIALVGSGEYLPVMKPVDRHLLASVNANGRKPRVVCLATAAGQEGQASIDRWMQMGIAHFESLDAEVQAPPIIDRDSADDPSWEGLLQEADLIYFSGGNPMYLFQTLHGSKAWKAAEKAWKRGAVFAGCSAGAMILAQKVPNLRHAGLTSLDAFQRLPAKFILPHFDRMRGLWSAYLYGVRRQLKNGEFLLGVDENTALVGELEGTWQVLGQGQAHILTSTRQQSFHQGEEVPLPSAG